jgi:uncharacterized GH25 family protein
MMIGIKAFRTRAVIGILLLGAGPASAHEYWITPGKYRAQSGNLVAISAWVGTGFRGERKLYARSRTASLDLHTTRDFDLTRIASEGDTVFARAAAPDDSGLVVSFVSQFTFIEIEGDRFDRYLRDEGLDQPLAERARLGSKAGPGRERYRRCTKTWIAGPLPSARILRPLDLPLEIVPVRDPGRESRLKVRVLFEGRPLARALVRAWRAPLGPESTPLRVAERDSTGARSERRTDSRGEAVLDLAEPGEWLLSCVHMIPSREPEAADWESYWASLTFAR